jgi:hypothetical protein
MNKSFVTSLALSCLSLSLTIWINLSIASRYEQAVGKTRAVFGLTELTYGFQYWTSILGLAALIVGFRVRGNAILRLASILLSLVSIVLVFARIWRLFV